ncbi:AsnC family protein [Salmonella enterica]|nr:AsnC family protein [Salmonella enterica]ECP3756852.1 AsnC family protein [Salmonella enterica]ECW9090242.1 AsnC family protein [Salmonella enterica]
MILKPMGIPGKCPAHLSPWTTEEDELLISLFGKKTAAEIAALLPSKRTPAAILKRIQMLRELYPDRVCYICRRFTRAEDNFIRENCHTMTIAEVAAHLNRAYTSVKSRRGTLGVSFFKCGERHHTAKYPDEIVIHVQEWRDDFGLAFREIDRRLGAPKGTSRHLYLRRLTADYAIAREYLPR